MILMDIMKTVRFLVESELTRSKKVYEEKFHSTHEGYGVLMEEFWEAAVEGTRIASYKDLVMEAIHDNDYESLKTYMNVIESSALNAAYEYIQVAAMSAKMKECLKGGETDGKND